MEYRMVEVVWVDAEELGDVGWNNLSKQKRDAKKPCPTVRSVGFVLYENDKHISLASTIGKDLCSTVEKIPKSFVQHIEELSYCKTKIITQPNQKK
tara:strand:+ start:1277 stop:1564 length:288 start_codon:yes stop_codon:yes gene_type:complete